MSKYKCRVPRCPTGQCGIVVCKGKQETVIEEDSQRKVLFKVPSDSSELGKWRKNIPYAVKYVVPGKYICEVHFSESCIERFIETEMADGSIRQIKRTKPVLKSGAVPTIFVDCPSSVYDNLTRVNPPPGIKPPQIDNKLLLNSSNKHPILYRNGTSLTNVESKKSNILTIPIKHFKIPLSNGDIPVETIQDLLKTKNPEQIFELKLRQNVIALPNGSREKLADLSSIEDERFWVKKTREIIRHLSDFNKKRHEDQMEDKDMHESVDQMQILVVNLKSEHEERFNWENLTGNLHKIKLPSKFWTTSKVDFEQSVVFINWSWDCVVTKKVSVNKNMKYRVFLRDKEVSVQGYERAESYEEVTKLLRLVEGIVLCEGLGPTRGFTSECPGHAPPRQLGHLGLFRVRCDHCRDAVRQAPVFARREQQRLQTNHHLRTLLTVHRNKYRNLQRSAQRLRGKVNKLKIQLKKKRSNVKEKEEEEVEEASATEEEPCEIQSRPP